MKLDLSFIWTAFIQILPAIPNTLFITVVSVFIGFLIGTFSAIVRIYKVPFLSQIASGYVTIVRGTPMITHLLIIYYSLSMLLDSLAKNYHLPFNSASIPMMVFAIISFSITAGAYLSEVVRAGITSIERGQIEAAYSVGMTTTQALKRIIFPQAFAISLPNLSNTFIGMLHGSTLAFIVSVVDINAKAQIVASTNWKFFEAYIAAALIFWGITIVIEKMTSLLEKRFSVFSRGGVK
ncbi:amino acid ABC transporter permease [Gottfriedia solisilvae]|uniref:Cysteine ABC transporter permease n=1 Tax=Gottfriedia solisilvae TaxID=1516104 RepID=A0A8J3EZK8_9BACI|nr:amino acid ABC transporter permease [Gottfriedia solisilvae]GGI15397.1 cysteine ABC transporter permease [Gottfriedia solisilvae]